MMKLTSPVFAMILVVGNNVAAGDKLGQIDHAVECGVDHQARNEAVGSAESKRNEHYGYEGWDCIANVSPVDRRDLSHHQATDLCLCQRQHLEV